MTAPNFVILLADDMTMEQLRRMPMVHKYIAKKGVNFFKHYVSTPLCQPARATIFSGQFSHNHGIISNTTPYTDLDPSTLFAPALKSAGYNTCYVGKYLNRYLVTDNSGAVPVGWDEWHATSLQKYYSFNINDNGVVTARGATEDDYHTTVCKDKAVDFINSAVEPFFMEVGFIAPHFESSVGVFAATPPKAYANVIPNTKLAPRDANFNAEIVNAPSYMALSAMTGTTIDSIDAFYRGQTEELFALDQAVKAIVEALIAANKYDNTYIVFASDNGYMHGEHRDPGEKIVPYVASCLAPMIIAGPASAVTRDSFCTRLVSQVDMTATLFAVTGATPGRLLDGVSLVPLLQNPHGPALHSAVLVEFMTTINLADVGITVPPYQMLISDHYKYCEYPDSGEAELFDLNSDPYELTNQAGNSDYVSIKSALAAQLLSVKECAGSGCTI